VTTSSATTLAATLWLRLVRTGNVFIGYRSSNGTTWTEQSRTTLSQASKLNLGIALASASTTATATAVIDSLTVTTTANQTPTVTIKSPAAGYSIVQGNALNLSAVAVDMENGDISSRTTWTDSVAGALGTGAQLSISTLAVGTHTITASAKDDASLTGSAIVTITVVAAPVPTISISTPATMSTVQQSTNVTLTSVAKMSTGEDLSTLVLWNSSRDGDLGYGATLTTSALSIGRHTITASVTNAGKTATATILLEVTTDGKPGWLVTDIGSHTAGTGSLATNVMTLKGAGTNLATTDDFSFFNRYITGNFTATFRVSGLTATATSASVGWMARESLAAQSAYVWMRTIPKSTTVGMRYRTTATATATDKNTTGVSTPIWIRLVRSGNTFTGYTSTNGTTWTSRASFSVTQANSLYLGAAVISGSSTELANVSIDNVTLTQP
ncbi:MAG TPA: hypothetical protein VFM46_15550, partial [Pseudomonadales bacterium]|nr:hypothetical protein [Pseudomonadales bacterium]